MRLPVSCHSKCTDPTNCGWINSETPRRIVVQIGRDCSLFQTTHSQTFSSRPIADALISNNSSRVGVDPVLQLITVVKFRKYSQPYTCCRVLDVYEGNEIDIKHLPLGMKASCIYYCNLTKKFPLSTVPDILFDAHPC